MNDRPRVLQEIIPPLLLVLALVMLIAGFASLAVERPQPSVELHRARLEGSEQYQAVLEQDLQMRRVRRVALTVSLFAGAVILATFGYLTMTRV